MTSRIFGWKWSALWLVAALIVAVLATSQRTVGQISTGDGSDGPLTLTTPGTVDLSSLGKDPDRDNVYNFTTINIGSGVTLTMSGQKIDGPVAFLSQGDVVIAGTMDLRGGNGHPSTSIPSLRLPSIPGPGGYPGGVGGDLINAAQPGGGPAGGSAGNGTANGAHGGGFSGNSFLVPLVGGSGGGGQRAGCGFCTTDGGGAGGGAILVASSTSITVSGSILASGGGPGNPDSVNQPQGNSFCAGGGSGGAVRLVAPVLKGSGTINVSRGFAIGGATATGGTVRLEAFQNLSGLSALGGATVRASPTALALGPHPSLRVVSIGGFAVPASPTGSFTVPDVTINTPSPVPVNIEARNIPAGTIVRLLVFSESAPDMVLDTPGLVAQGADGLLTTSISVTFPTGYSRGFAKASYTQQF